MKHRGLLRRRVAVLLDAIEDDYQAEILRGVVHESGRANVDLLCIAGGVVSDDVGHPSHSRNFLFDLFDPSSVDGILLLSGALGNALGPEKYAKWVERFRGTPLVHLGLQVPGFDSIEIDGARAMFELVDHLVRAHGKTRVAFLRGPTTSQDAEQRYDAYRAALESNGVAFDPALVYQGNWHRDSGAPAVHEWLDVRGLHLRGVGAIVCANDYMALGVLDALRARGWSVPHDVLLTGFDDLKIVRTAVPPLTTVRQPSSKLGAEGLKRLLASIHRPEPPTTQLLPALVVERGSCGCRSRVAPVGGHARKSTGAGLHASLLDRRALLTAELSRAARGTLQGVGSGWEERLLSAFLADLTGSTEHSFLGAIERMITKLPLHSELGVLHALLDVLRDSIRAALDSDVHATTRAADLLDAARQLVADTALRSESYRSAEAAHYLREMTAIAGTFLSSESLDATRAAREKKLESLGQNAFSLGIFTEPGRATENCSVAIGLTLHHAMASIQSFPARGLAPEAWFRECEAPVLVQPLVWDDEPQGIVAFPLGPLEGPIYEQVRETLGLGLRSYWLAHAPVPPPETRRSP